MSYTYLVLPFVDVTPSMVAACVQTRLDTVRRSSDGNAILKWRGDRPPVLAARGTVWRHENLRVELQRVEWNRG